jgi:hypothetical protein
MRSGAPLGGGVEAAALERISQGFELALSMALLAVAEIRVAHLPRRHTFAEVSRFE